MRKDSANNRSSYSEKEPPNLDSRSRRFTRERVFLERGCQEHFSPYAGGADLFRDIQPLSPWTLVWCPALGCSIAAAASSLVATTPISLETHQAVRLYGGNHGSI